MVEFVAARAERVQRQVNDKLGQDVDQAGAMWRQHIIDAAAGDDELLLRLLADHLRAVEQHAECLRDIRDEAAFRLREEGVAMTRIAALARVSDSYMTRRLIKRKGAKPKTIRVPRRTAATGFKKGGAALGAAIIGLSPTAAFAGGMTAADDTHRARILPNCHDHEPDHTKVSLFKHGMYPHTDV